MSSPIIKFGIDILIQKQYFNQQKIALVTNDAATTSSLILNRVALLQAGYSVTKLFSAEHGITSNSEDGMFQDDVRDNITGLPVISLYGERLSPTEEDLEDIDIVIFDLPDIGCRFYTYQWTLSYIMEACKKFHKRLVVLDRPNPLSGNLELAEGPMLDHNCSSFLGRWNIPLRHSCTIGELALCWKQYYCPNLDLTVIPVSGLRREFFYDDLLMPFIPASPGMPAFDNALLYPGTGLLEGINVSEGRGTTLPFRICGAPWIKSVQLSDAFNNTNPPAVKSIPYTFKPIWGKYANENCNGILLTVTAKKYFLPVKTGLVLMNLLMNLYNDKIEPHYYKTRANPTGESHLDKLTGVRNSFDWLKKDGETFRNELSPALNTENWRHTIQPFLLYAD